MSRSKNLEYDQIGFSHSMIAKNKYHLDGYFTVISKKYQKYRNISKSFNETMVQMYYIGHDSEKACKLLKIDFSDIAIFFKSEMEMNSLADFMISDMPDHGKNAIQKYQQEVGGKTKLEKGILDAMATAYTSLFSVEKTDILTRTAVLRDVLNNTKITMTDNHLTLTMQKGMLLFCRIMTFDGISLNSGTGFVFPGNFEKLLIRKSKIIMKKMKEYPEQTARYAAFFQLNREYGLNLMQLD